MTKKYFPLLVLILSLSIPPVFSQNDHTYITTDSVTSIGINLKKGSQQQNALFIRVKVGDSIISYSPKEVKEYGFKDGTVYFSKKVSLFNIYEPVFLERLIEGKISLYYYKGRNQKAFFIEKDSGDIVKLEKDKQAFLEMSSDCQYIGDATRLASHNRKSLERLVSNYNACESKSFPYGKFGLIAGLSMTRLEVPPKFSNVYMRDLSFDPTPSWFVGLYTDIPVGMGNLSLNLGLNYLQHSFSQANISNQIGTDIITDVSILEVPLLLRYTAPRLGWRPFFNVGVNYSYILNQSNAIYTSEIGSNIITIDKVRTAPFFGQAMLGYSAGIGLQHNVDIRRTVSTEIRYSQHWGLENTLGKQQLNFVLGFSL